MKKILAALLGLFLTLTLLGARGDPAEFANTAPPTTDGIAKTTEAQTATAPILIGSERGGAIPGKDPAATVNGPPKAPEGTVEILAAYAAAVDKTLAANKQVSKHCMTVIKKPLDADEGITKLLSISIGGFSVEKVVYNLLGEGDATYEATYNQPMKDALQKSYLRTDDVSSASAAIDEKGAVSLIINVKNCSDPAKLGKGSSPLGRFTWDYTNVKTVDDGIVSAQKRVPGLRITIAKKIINYYNIKITATISPDGILTHLVHSYNYTGRVEDVEVKLLGVRMGGGEWGQVAATGTITYNI